MKGLNTQRGIGLLELMLSLAIIAILLVMATRYFASARQGQEVASALSQLQAITAGYANASIAGQAPTSVSALQSGGYVSNIATTNPWGGSIALAPGSVQGSVSVTYSGVPAGPCNELAGALKNLATPGTTPQCSGGTVTADLGGAQAGSS